jgi:hypothetical protein
MEAERIRQLEEEARIIGQRQFEDFQSRLDAATPGNEREEAIAANARKLDRELEDLIRSFGPEIDAREAATLAVAQAAIAAEKEAFARDKATTALNNFSTAVRNAPTGFKLEPYIQQFARGAPFPGTTPINTLPVPVNPFVPPTSPLSPTMPAMSRTGTVATAPISVASLTINVTGAASPELTASAVKKAFLGELDKTVSTTQGLNGSRSAALEVMS